MDEEISDYGIISLMTLPSESGVRLPANSVRRKRWLKVLHEDLKILVGLLQNCELRGFVVKNQGISGVEVRTATRIVLL